MSKVMLPENYSPVIDLMESQRAIKKVKDFFQQELAYGLNLRRVTAPLFVTPESGLNDNLNGVERTVSFTLKDGALGDDDWAENGEIVDPSGPVAAAPDNGGGSTRSAHPVPTLGAWGALLLPALVGLLGLRRFKAKMAAST